MQGFRPKASASSRGRPVLLLLPLLSLTLAILACGVSFRMGAATLKVADVPTTQLHLQLRITGQFSGMPNVLVLPLFFEGPNAQEEVALPQGAKVTCNGTDITPLSPTTIQVARPCPHQPPGGSYRITYTDAHGAATTVLVPVPVGGSFDLLSPAPNTTVRIPTNGKLEIRYRAPTPPPNGSLTLDSVAARCDDDQQPCILSAFPPFGDSLTSSGGAGNVAALARGAIVPTQAPTPKPGATLKPGNTPVPSPTPARGNAYASLTVRDGVGTILLRGDFSMLQAGPGDISLEVEGQETLDHAGFADASVKLMIALLDNHITWTN